MKQSRRGRLSKTVCSETKSWLKGKGMEQSEWAELIGTKYMTVWCWLKYGHMPDRDHEKAIRLKTPDCPLLRAFDLS